ncbi:P [Niakha virus]|uniref:P n=1 Tax=Niakha virus TaxID=1348439 RepID=R9ZQ01_9RHAB|nr:P [Niakha virus] [Niakha virus]AGO44081.1 P [Niakha virus] [Niakha virus]
MSFDAFEFPSDIAKVAIGTAIKADIMEEENDVEYTTDAAEAKTKQDIQIPESEGGWTWENPVESGSKGKEKKTLTYSSDEESGNETDDKEDSKDQTEITESGDTFGPLEYPKMVELTYPSKSFRNKDPGKLFEWAITSLFDQLGVRKLHFKTDRKKGTCQIMFDGINSLKFGRALEPEQLAFTKKPETPPPHSSPKKPSAPRLVEVIEAQKETRTVFKEGPSPQKMQFLLELKKGIRVRDIEGDMVCVRLRDLAISEEEVLGTEFSGDMDPVTWLSELKDQFPHLKRILAMVDFEEP